MSMLAPDRLIPVADLDAYLFDPTGQDWGNLLAPFSPPLPRKGQVILASFFCDVFVEDEHGAIWWVNGLEGGVGKIAINRDKAFERITAEHLPMLKTKLMEQLIRADKLLPKGMLYGLTTPRSAGGKYHPDNVGTATIADSFAFLGDQFRAKTAPTLQPEPTAVEAKPKKSFWGKKS